MAAKDDLTYIGNVIEGALVDFDKRTGRKIKDEAILAILKSLLDKYYFKQDKKNTPQETACSGFEHVDSILIAELPNIENHEKAKIINTIYRLAERRSKGRREYLDFIDGFFPDGPSHQKSLITNILSLIK